MANPTNATSPTYRAFMNTGTELVMTSMPGTCGICLEAYTNPTELLLCGHIFDNACLQSWFNSSHQPITCPMCRAALFTRDTATEILDIIHGSEFVWQTFDIPEPTQQFPSDVRPPAGNLIATLLSAPEDIVARVDLDVVAFCLRQVPNFLLAAAQARGSPLADDESSELRHIVQTMYIFLSRKKDNEMLALLMPLEVLLGTVNVLKESGLAVNIDAILPEDLTELQDEPAARAVQLAFFVTWACLDRSDKGAWWASVSQAVSAGG